MHARSRLVALMGLALALSPAVASSDVMPEEELEGMFEIKVSVEMTGLARFPDHVFYLFPAYCTQELNEFRNLNRPEWHEDAHEGPNYVELRDGDVVSWLGAEGECEKSRMYALARDIAAGIDLNTMSLEKLEEFFLLDDRVFASSFLFVDRPLYADRGSLMRGVHEVVRLLRIDAEDELVVVLDAATYEFADGTEQTLKLGHTKRPPLPFRPLKPEKVAKYAMVNAKWEARQPAEPPPAPRVPEQLPDPPPPVAEAPAAEGAVEAAVPVEPVPVAVQAVAAPAVAPTLALATVDDVSPPEVVEPPRAEPPPPTAAAPAFDLLATRGWPLAAGFAGLVVVVGGVVWARRRR
jgi:hypothetical protein